MVEILSENELMQRITKADLARPFYAMYSSIWGGIVKDPRWMLLPIDDHMVHRGDGVFEAIKFSGGRAYLLDAHIERLLSSAERIGIKAFAEASKLRSIIEATMAASGKDDGLLRIFMSRGPGSFSVNPYDTVGTQFYVIVTALIPPSLDKYEKGVSVGLTNIGVKDSWMAQVKSCNYLPNVMMKKEAVDRGFDFVVAFDEQGFLAESSTENMAIVSAEGYLVKPNLSQILKGTTMTRVFELAGRLLQKGHLKGLESRDISIGDIVKSKEIMMLGTTLDVLPVTRFEQTVISKGVAGPIASELLALLRQDQENEQTFRDCPT
jgi:4-amino-4-deoxychorismate lyase